MAHLLNIAVGFLDAKNELSWTGLPLSGPRDHALFSPILNLGWPFDIAIEAVGALENNGATGRGCSKAWP